MFFKVIWQMIVDVFGPIFKEGLRGTARWILQDGPKFLRGCALFFLCLSLALGYLLWTRLANAGAVLISSLSERQENTSQPYKGLEALLLSGRTVDTDRALADRKLNPKIKQQFATFSRPIDERVTDQTSQALAPAVLTFIRSGSVGFLTDDSPGFLFVPSIVAANHKIFGSKGPTVELAPESEPDLVRDVSFSQSAAQGVCDLLTIPIFEADAPGSESEPVQSYLITRTGVARLCEREVSSQRAYYREQFPATTLFQDRPYFDPAIAKVKENNGGDKASDYFYSTRVYIDLGGNGFVKTFCRAVSLTPPEAIVCVDLRLGADIEDRVRAKLSAFGPNPVRVSCTSQKCEQEEKLSWWNQVTGLFSDDDLRLLNYRIGRYGGSAPRLAEVFGQISVHQSVDLPRAADSPHVPYEGLIFTVPISSRIDGDTRL